MASAKSKDGGYSGSRTAAASGRDAKTDAAKVFRNSDESLKRKAIKLLAERKELGLDGLVGDLRYIIINTEPMNLKQGVEELIGVTGHELVRAYETKDVCACEISLGKGPDMLVTSRKAPGPFRRYAGPKSRHLPDTRLETFVFEVRDMAAYLEAQRKRGVKFMTRSPVKDKGTLFIQTEPSNLTGNSIGLIEYTDGVKNPAPAKARALDWKIKKPRKPHLKDILEIDHVATRVRSNDRDKAILEFMGLTNHRFDFAIYVEAFNSITNVARAPSGKFAMVFTSGISPYKGIKTSGPTEKFVHNYGPRTHHLAFNTRNIESTFEGLKAGGMGFLLPLVGSEDEGLKQTFSKPSPNTLLVNEYIKRYHGFDGFFTKSNVTLLTGSTDQQ